MTILTESVLIESKSARDEQLVQMPHERAQEILVRIKALYFALWQGTGITTTEQLAEFYEVPVGTIRPLLKPYQIEFESDGVKTLRSKALKEARCVIQLPSETSQALIWTPRAALRLGMLLRDSAIAKAVRTSLLDAVEKVLPAQAEQLRQLELENENLKLQLQVATAQQAVAVAQKDLAVTTNAIATLHGPSMVALILGKPDAIVERVTEVEKTVLCNERGQPLKTFRGLSKTKLAKRYGLKKPQDFVAWLHSLGKAELLQKGLTTTPCEFVSWESIEELDHAWSQRQGTRQRLLGE